MAALKAAASGELPRHAVLIPAASPAPSLLLPLLEPALRSVEGFANDHVGVFVRGVGGIAARHHQAAAGYVKVDVYAIVIPLLMVLVGQLDRHVAGGDARAEPLQTRGALGDVLLDGFGRANAIARPSALV